MRLMHYIRLGMVILVFATIQRALVVLSNMDNASAALIAVLSVAMAIGVTNQDDDDDHGHGAITTT